MSSLNSEAAKNCMESRTWDNISQCDIPPHLENLSTLLSFNYQRPIDMIENKNQELTEASPADDDIPIIKEIQFIDISQDDEDVQHDEIDDDVESLCSTLIKGVDYQYHTDLVTPPPEVQ